MCSVRYNSCSSYPTTLSGHSCNNNSRRLSFSLSPVMTIKCSHCETGNCTISPAECLSAYALRPTVLPIPSNLFSIGVRRVASSVAYHLWKSEVSCSILWDHCCLGYPVGTPITNQYDPLIVQ